MGQLEALGLEALRLKCQDRRVPTNGRERELALRLYATMHPTLGADETSSSDENEAVLNNPPPEIIRAEDEADAEELPNPPEPVIQDTVEEEETIPYDEDVVNNQDDDDNPPFPQPDPNQDTVADDSNQLDNQLDNQQQDPGRQPATDTANNIAHLVQAAVDTAMANTVKGLMEEIKNNQEQANASVAENEALRSEIQALRKQASANTRARKTTTQPQPSAPPPPASPPAARKRTITTNTRTARSASNVTFSTPAAGMATVSTGNTSSGASGTHGVPTSATQGNTVFSNVPPPFYPAVANPIPLPALLQRDLLAIEKEEYVDFDRIKPKKAGERSGEDGEDGFRVSMRVIRDEDGEETLGFKKSGTSKIENFAEWLQVWNKFLAAMLHYHPNQHSALLVYQQTITSLCRTHKFHAVYEFDKAVRKTIAAEKSRALGERQVFWHTQPEWLKNEYLFGQAKTPTFCYNCNKKGHVADNCTKNSSGRNRSGASGSSGGGSNNWQQENYHPYQNQNPRRGNRNNQQRNNQQNEQYNHTPSLFDYPLPPPPPPTPPNNNRNNNGNRNTSNYCRSFNHNGSCFRGPNCHFPHRCNRCHDQDHGGINCMRNTSTGFRPSFG